MKCNQVIKWSLSIILSNNLPTFNPKIKLLILFNCSQCGMLKNVQNGIDILQIQAYHRLKENVNLINDKKN